MVRSFVGAQLGWARRSFCLWERCCSNGHVYQTMCKFGILIGGGGELENVFRVRSSRVSGTARQNLSPTWKYYLGTAVRAVRA